MLGSEDIFQPQVGITLITGFLGSGKSTLIQRVLTEKHNLRIVVVENEFGPTAVVEKAIVTQGVGPDVVGEFIELPNGCICCAAQDDLVDALTRLVEQKAGKFDHILIEASGLADPRPVAASLWVDDVVGASLRLDAVIAVVDAANVEVILEGGSDFDATIALKQLAVADVVILNKMDLVCSNYISLPSCDVDQIDRLSSILRRNGCHAQVIPATRCNVDLRELLDVRAYESVATVNTLSKIVPEKFRDHAHVDKPNPATSFTLSFQGTVFSASLLTHALGELLWEQSNNYETSAQQIWRMKALVVIENEPFKWIYQSVHTLFDDSVSTETIEADSAVSNFLFIGQKMDQQSIRRRLMQAITSSSTTSDVDGNRQNNMKINLLPQ